MASETELKWLDSVTSGSLLKDATKEHFNCSTASSLSAKTSVLKSKFADEISNALQKEMKMCAPQAFKTIMSLAADSDQDAVKLKACQDILDRTGYKPALQVEDVTDREPKTEAEALVALASAIKNMEDDGITINQVLADKQLDS